MNKLERKTWNEYLDKGLVITNSIIFLLQEIQKDIEKIETLQKKQNIQWTKETEDEITELSNKSDWYEAKFNLEHKENEKFIQLTDKYKNELTESDSKKANKNSKPRNGKAKNSGKPPKKGI